MDREIIVCKSDLSCPQCIALPTPLPVPVPIPLSHSCLLTSRLSSRLPSPFLPLVLALALALACFHSHYHIPSPPFSHPPSPSSTTPTLVVVGKARWGRPVNLDRLMSLITSSSAASFLLYHISHAPYSVHCSLSVSPYRVALTPFCPHSISIHPNSLDAILSIKTLNIRSLKARDDHGGAWRDD